MKQKVTIFFIVLAGLMMLEGSVKAQTATQLKQRINDSITTAVAPRTIRATNLGARMEETVTFADFIKQAAKITDSLNGLNYLAQSFKYTTTLVTGSMYNDTGRDGIKSFILHNRLYVVGGWNGTLNPTVTNIILSYDLTNLSAPPVVSYGPFLPRHAVMCYVVGDTAVYGGSDFQLASGKQFDVWISYESGVTGVLTWERTNPICKGCSMGFTEGAYNPYDGYYYYGGGQRAVNWRVTTNPLSDTLWRTKDFFRTSEFVARIDSMKGNIIGTMQFFGKNKLHFISGGYYSGNPLDRTYRSTHLVYDVETKTLERRRNFPGTPVQYPTTLVYNGLLYFYGGHDGVNNSSQYWTYDANGNWKSYPNTGLPPTHASSLAGFVDANGVHTIIRAAGNIDDSMFKVVLSPGYVQQDGNATLGAVTATSVSTSNFSASGTISAPSMKPDTLEAPIVKTNSIAPKSGAKTTTAADTIDLTGVVIRIGNSTNGYVYITPGSTNNLVSSFAADRTTAKNLALIEKLLFSSTGTQAPRAAIDMRLGVIPIGDSAIAISHGNGITFYKRVGNSFVQQATYSSGQIFSTIATLGGTGQLIAGINIDVNSSNLPVGARNTSDGLSYLDFHYINGFTIHNNTSTTLGTDYSTDNDLNVSLAGNTNIGGATDNSKAILNVASTTKGALLPRMTSTQRDAITSPTEGLEIYNLTTHKKEVYDGSTWQACW